MWAIHVMSVRQTFDETKNIHSNESLPVSGFPAYDADITRFDDCHEFANAIWSPIGCAVPLPALKSSGLRRLREYDCWAPHQSIRICKHKTNKLVLMLSISLYRVFRRNPFIWYLCCTIFITYSQLVISILHLQALTAATEIESYVGSSRGSTLKTEYTLTIALGRRCYL